MQPAPALTVNRQHQASIHRVAGQLAISPRTSKEALSGFCDGHENGRRKKTQLVGLGLVLVFNARFPEVELNDDFLAEIYRKEADGSESPMMKARKLLSCGLEIPLPDGKAIEDKAGHKHKDMRIANWRHWAKEFHEVALVPKGQEELLRGMEWPADLVISAIEGSPIFVGHHWFTGHPVIESSKLACLDWSAAKDGPLVAYRWDGESELSNDKLAWVGKR